jgi:hypothetical protein
LIEERSKEVGSECEKRVCIFEEWMQVGSVLVDGNDIDSMIVGID